LGASEENSPICLICLTCLSLSHRHRPYYSAITLAFNFKKSKVSVSISDRIHQINRRSQCAQKNI
jgi:hypothetical protein